MTFSISNILDTYVRQNGKTWDHGRHNTVGASEIGQCARRTWYIKHDTPHDEGFVDRWGPRVRGDMYEAFWDKALRAAVPTGVVVAHSGEDQRTFVKGFLSATPDAIVDNLPADALDGIECIVAECKSIDPRVDLRQAKAEHTYQAQVQMGLVRETTNWQPTHALISYIDASWPDDVTEFIVEFDPKIYAYAQQRARTIMSTEDPMALKPEGIIAGGKECKWCPFRMRCSRGMAALHPDGKEPLSEDQGAKLIALIDEYDTVRDEADQVDAELGQVKHDIKELLKSANTRWAQVDGRKVSWQSRKGRVSYDRAAMKADGIDFEKYEREGDPFDVLTVK